MVKNYKSFRAVNDISFTVKRGETFAILGANGAGKSTTMRMIACRSPLDGGELFVEGFDVKKADRQIRALIGVVPQENNLDPDLNVRENLMIYSRYFRIHKAEKVLLLDEPTTGLDSNVRQEIWEKLEELRRTENLTIILSTHYMEEAEKLCHRLIVMSRGKVVAEGVPRELITEKARRYTLEVCEIDSPLIRPVDAVFYLSNEA